MCQFERTQDMNIESIKKLLEEKWEINPFDFWIPLSGKVLANTCYFDTKDFEKYFSFKNLNSIINEKLDGELVELNETKEIKIYPTLELQSFPGLDTFYTNENVDWIIYITHESTIAFAGFDLIGKIKDQWLDYKKYINPWTNDYFEKEIVKKRAKVWEAISKFYLDTELQDVDYKNISSVFIDSGFSVKELMEIDKFEVFPTLQNNLNSTTGEWSGFNKELLIANCLQNYYKKDSFIFRLTVGLKNKLFFNMRKIHWELINKHIKTNT
uniref:DUF7079 family protein n=1 Tax=Labilibacter marinus TaxID=1477105 RepID=UPI001E3DA83E